MLGFAKWAPIFLFLWLFAIPLNGLAISLTWDWFVAPILGTRQITIMEGVGLSIFLSVIKQPLYDRKPDPKDASASLTEALGKAIGAALVIGVFAPLLTIGIAWIWHTFFMPISN